MNSGWTIMIQVPKADPTPAGVNLADEKALERSIIRALDFAHLQEALPPEWMISVRTIAIPLIGSGPLNYGCDNSAETIVRAITRFFANDFSRIQHFNQGPAPAIVLLVPTTITKGKDTRTIKSIKEAWQKAWE